MGSTRHGSVRGPWATASYRADPSRQLGRRARSRPEVLALDGVSAASSDGVQPARGGRGGRRVLRPQLDLRVHEQLRSEFRHATDGDRDPRDRSIECERLGQRRRSEHGVRELRDERHADSGRRRSRCPCQGRPGAREDRPDQRAEHAPVGAGEPRRGAEHIGGRTERADRCAASLERSQSAAVAADRDHRSAAARLRPDDARDREGPARR